MVRLAEPFDQPRAQHIHGGVFQPAAAGLGNYDDDFGSVRFAQALCEGRADGGRTEILILNIDPAARRGDGVLEKILDLAHGGLSGVLRRGPRDGDSDILQIRRH